MIHTLLLEPYKYPKVVPIEVTILRGARRLRFSSALRKKYGDFAPKIWHYLARLGYKKFLQRIYVAIENDTALTSPYYQFPVLLSVLEALSLIPKMDNLLSVGKIDEYGHAISPLQYQDIPVSSLLPWYLPQRQTLNQELNLLLTGNFKKADNTNRKISPSLLQLLFPDCQILNNSLLLNHLSTNSLRKIDSELLAHCPITADLNKVSILKNRYPLLEQALCNSETINVITQKKEVVSMTTSSFLKLISNDKVKT